MQFDCAKTYRNAKDAGHSFYFDYLHKIMQAANSIEALRLRIEDNLPVLYNTVGVSPTVLRKDNTFGCAFFPYSEDFETFTSTAADHSAIVHAKPGFCPDPEGERVDSIYFSALPWVHFTSLENESDTGGNRGIPSISVGKAIWQGDKFVMPLCIRVHHALVDGLDVGNFTEILQKILDE